MKRKGTFRNILRTVGGYYLIPHELLHVLAYRIIGKPCRYRWGDYAVQSLAPKNRREKLFVLLLPFGVCWILGLLFHFIWLVLAVSTRMPPETYFFEAPVWHFALPIIATLFLIYSGTAHQDLIDAYSWLFVYNAEYDDAPNL